ncbi:ABC transporter ATP-binding protein, partial [termite gut metagenome]
MITVENLSFTYRQSKEMLLKNFSLSLERGKVYGLL